MSLNIKNAEAERLARALAAVTGESVTRAVMVAVRERLERTGGEAPRKAEERRLRLRALSADAGDRWAEALRGVDHAELLYDRDGLPR